MWNEKENVIKKLTIFQAFKTVLVYCLALVTAPVSAPVIAICGGLQVDGFLKAFPKAYGKWWGTLYGLCIGAVFAIVMYPVYQAGWDWTLLQNWKTLAIVQTGFIVTFVIARDPVRDY